MKMISEVLCMYCKKNKVPVEKWNRRCPDCKANQINKSKDNNVMISKSMPAAILTDVNGNQIFVDKHGRKVNNPGYDLENDPRGYKYAGKAKQKPVII